MHVNAPSQPCLQLMLYPLPNIGMIVHLDALAISMRLPHHLSLTHTHTQLTYRKEMLQRVARQCLPGNIRMPYPPIALVTPYTGLRQFATIIQPSTAFRDVTAEAEAAPRHVPLSSMAPSEPTTSAPPVLSKAEPNATPPATPNATMTLTKAQQMLEEFTTQDLELLTKVTLAQQQAIHQLLDPIPVYALWKHVDGMDERVQQVLGLSGISASISTEQDMTAQKAEDASRPEPGATSLRVLQDRMHFVLGRIGAHNPAAKTASDLPMLVQEHVQGPLTSRVAQFVEDTGQLTGQLVGGAFAMCGMALMNAGFVVAGLVSSSILYWVPLLFVGSWQAAARSMRWARLRRELSAGLAKDAGGLREKLLVCSLFLLLFRG
jgi:hypothetical protein